MSLDSGLEYARKRQLCQDGMFRQALMFIRHLSAREQQLLEGSMFIKR